MQVSKHIAALPPFVKIGVVKQVIPPFYRIFIIQGIGVFHCTHFQVKIIPVGYTFGTASTCTTAPATALCWFIVLPGRKARVKSKIGYQEKCSVMPAVIAP